MPAETSTPADPEEKRTITFVLRPPATAAHLSDQLLSGNFDASAATPASLAADPADMQSALDFIDGKGLTVVSKDANSRTIKASGTVKQLEGAFGVALRMSLRSDGSAGAMFNESALAVPEAINGPVVAVLGLDQRPVARHHDAS